jgi:hypothetical protein
MLNFVAIESTICITDTIYAYWRNRCSVFVKHQAVQPGTLVYRQYDRARSGMLFAMNPRMTTHATDTETTILTPF